MEAHIEVTISKRHFNVCVPMSIIIRVFFAFYAKSHDSWEIDFWEKSPVDSADTQWVKNFVEIALSRSVFEINPYLHLMQKFKMATKSGGKRFLEKVASRLCTYPVGKEFRRNRSISLRFRDKCFFAFYAETQDGWQKCRKNNFRKKSPVDSADTLRIKNFVEIALSHSVSEINAFLRFTQKFKMAGKSVVKIIFGRSPQ